MTGEQSTQKKGKNERRDEERESGVLRGRSTRNSRACSSRGGRRIKSPVGGINITRKPPSAATLVAKRKTRMATLTAASSSVSRMLTRDDEAIGSFLSRTLNNFCENTHDLTQMYTSRET